MIGRAIKKRREELGLRQEELAKMIGVGKTSISNYEQNVSSPREDIMVKLFSALQCDANYLYQDFLTRVEVTPHEKKVLEAYREQQQVVKDSIDRMLSVTVYNATHQTK